MVFLCIRQYNHGYMLDSSFSSFAMFVGICCNTTKSVKSLQFLFPSLFSHIVSKDHSTRHQLCLISSSMSLSRISAAAAARRRQAAEKRKRHIFSPLPVRSVNVWRGKSPGGFKEDEGRWVGVKGMALSLIHLIGAAAASMCSVGVADIFDVLGAQVVLRRRKSVWENLLVFTEPVLY